jgi:transcription initiation factor TFIIH subunit 1
MALARQSIHHVVDGDEDAQCGGGVDSEMQRLVRFASAKEDQVDHVRCEGVVVDMNEPSRSTGHGQEDRSTTQSILYKDLNLKNIGVYAGCFHPDIMDDTTTTDRTRSTTAPSRHVLFSKLMMERMKGVMNPDANEPKPTRLDATAAALPEPSFGREILKALTKRMVEDSITEEDAIKITQGLPDDFKQQVASYFRRCSELLRHFFALRRVIELEKMSPSPQGTDRLLIKSKKIIKAMEDVYREMESIRNGFPVTAVGETMRKIYLSIMNQLDWAFKLNRDSSSTGGFVSVDD